MNIVSGWCLGERFLEVADGLSLTVHGNASDDALTEMLLELVSTSCNMHHRRVIKVSKLTATSRVSFWPPLSVDRAFRIGGSFAVSNLTVISESIQWASFYFRKYSELN